MPDRGVHRLADPYAAIDGWRLIAEILRVVPSATVTEYRDEIDGSVLAVSDSGWGRCSVRLDGIGVEIVAPVLCQPWSWAAYRRQATPKSFARRIVHGLGQGGPGQRGPLSAEGATLIASLLALGLVAEEDWYVRAVHPIGLDGSNWKAFLEAFPDVRAHLVEWFEAAAASGERLVRDLDGWVLYCDAQPGLLLLNADDTCVLPALGNSLGVGAALLALAKAEGASR